MTKFSPGPAFASSLLVVAALVAAVAPTRADPVDTGARPGTAAPTGAYADSIGDRTIQATGLYFSGPFVGHFGARTVIDNVRRARVSAAVIDLKDSMGHAYYDSSIAELEGAERPYGGDTARVVRQIKEAGIYTIARITCFADRRLPARVPERAILHLRKNQPWVSWGTGGTWLDPYNDANHAMVLQMAVDAERLGFDEVQLDYVRWPVDDGVVYARYPSERTDVLRRFILKEMLRRIDAAIHIPLGVDVFGMSALHPGDPSGLGQSLEDWTDYVDVFSPMLYINAHSRWRAGEARGRAASLVQVGSANLRARVGPRPIIRPFMQAFAEGANYYNVGFIQEQIRGARSGQADGFLFWHPGVRYGMVRAAAGGAGPLPFDVSARAAAR